MTTDPFILFDRFEVEPSINLLTDRQSGRGTRLEPRLMALLCLLHNQEGQVVDREQITREIWDDYGNADEGLTQAISYLRKVLSDESKTLIETIPKKGYRLKKGEVQNKREAKSIRSPKWSLLLAGVIILVLVLWLIVRRDSGNPDSRKTQQEQQPGKQARDSVQSSDKFR